MMKKRTALVIILIVFFEFIHPLSLFTAGVPQKVVIVGIDLSGSYKSSWDQARNSVLRIIANLNPGESLYIRFITDNSYSDEAAFRSIHLPVIGTSHNMYDFKEKQRIQMQHKQVKLQKLRLFKEFKTRDFNKTGWTDVAGFILAASDKFALFETAPEKELILFSDMEDNLKYNPEVDLSGVSVKIYGFRGKKDPAKTQKLKSDLTKSFAEIGAEKVRFYSADELFAGEGL